MAKGISIYCEGESIMIGKCNCPWCQDYAKYKEDKKKALEDEQV